MQARTHGNQVDAASSPFRILSPPRPAPNVKGEMTASNIGKRRGRLHEHKAVTAHALRQHAGIPYEVEQKVCTDCRTVLDERTVRRAAA